MTATTNAENLRQYKIRFFIVEQILEESQNFKQIA